VTDGLCSLSRSRVLIFCCDAMLITPTAALRQVQPEVSAAAVKKGKRQLATGSRGNGKPLPLAHSRAAVRLLE